MFLQRATRTANCLENRPDAGFSQVKFANIFSISRQRTLAFPTGEALD
jgi:hypothetical protein